MALTQSHCPPLCSAHMEIVTDSEVCGRQAACTSFSGLKGCKVTLQEETPFVGDTGHTFVMQLQVMGPLLCVVCVFS